MFKTPSPLEKINHPLATQKGIELFIKRDDLIHPEVSGNKWRKLKYNIEKYKANNYDKILTFGGAYSNHIAATAKAGALLGIKTLGIIRGDELNHHSNQTLNNAYNNGMKLIFVSRSTYAERYEKLYHETLRTEFGNVLIINEGGANFHGVLGTIEIIKEINFEPDYIYTASGTGTTAAGLLMGSKNSKIISVPVFKKGAFIRDDIFELIQQFSTDQTILSEKLKLLELNTVSHFGGYGKFNTELIQFINEFYEITGIKLDQIYNGKMMFALINDIKNNKFKPGSKIVALHTGGLQGLCSIESQLKFKI